MRNNREREVKPGYCSSGKSLLIAQSKTEQYRTEQSNPEQSNTEHSKALQNRATQSKERHKEQSRPQITTEHAISQKWQSSTLDCDRL